MKKNINNLLEMFEIDKDGIKVNKQFVNRNKLTIFEIREIMRLLDAIKNKLPDSTINEKIAKILKAYGVDVRQSYIGWEV